MLYEEVKVLDKFEVLNKRLQAQNISTQQLVKPFTDLYEQAVVNANIRTLNEYFEEIRSHLKRLMVKFLFNLPKVKNYESE